MRTSSPTSAPLSEPHTLLLLGPPGGGKTSLMLRFPKLGVVNIDRALQAPDQWLRRIVPNLEYKYELPEYYDDNRVRAPEDVWPQVLICLNNMIADKEVQWIAVDGLTACNFHLINWICKKHGKEAMEQSLWIPYRAELLKLLNRAKLSGKNFIMTAHEETDTDRQGIVIRRKPFLDSKLKDAISGWFADVWRCTTTPGPGGTVKFLVNTRPSNVDELKCSSPNVSPDHTIDATNPKSFDFDKHILSALTVIHPSQVAAKSA